jgi:aminocarboxymuconate-semialdehyde decarboxylase
MAPYGPIGALFARGSANSASLVALVEGGVFAQLPGLRVVVTALAMGGVAMAAGLSSQSLLPSGAVGVMREHVFIDTTILHPASLRASVDLLGVDNVIAGSDWPINGGAFRGLLAGTMRDAGLSDDEQSAIAAGNCLRLLGIGRPPE